MPKKELSKELKHHFACAEEDEDNLLPVIKNIKTIFILDQDFKSCSAKEQLELSYEALCQLNALVNENVTHIVATVLLKDEIESLYTRLLSRLPVIPDNQIQEWNQLLQATSGILVDIFNVDSLLSELYTTDIELERLKPVFEFVYISGQIVETTLLNNKHVFYATDEKKEYILNLAIDAQVKNNGLWIPEHKWDYSCTDAFQTLSMLYMSLEKPSVRTKAKLLSFSGAVENTINGREAELSIVNFTKQRMDSAYRIFDNTRTLILGSNKDNLLDTARCLDVLGDYSYWMAALSKEMDPKLQQQSIEY